MIQKRPRLRGFGVFWTETGTAFFRSPPPEKLNLLPVFLARTALLVQRF